MPWLAGTHALERDRERGHLNHSSPVRCYREEIGYIDLLSRVSSKTCVARFRLPNAASARSAVLLGYLCLSRGPILWLFVTLVWKSFLHKAILARIINDDGCGVFLLTNTLEVDVTGYWHPCHGNCGPRIICEIYSFTFPRAFQVR